LLHPPCDHRRARTRHAISANHDCDGGRKKPYDWPPGDRKKCTYPRPPAIKSRSPPGNQFARNSFFFLLFFPIFCLFPFSFYPVTSIPTHSILTPMGGGAHPLLLFSFLYLLPRRVSFLLLSILCSSFRRVRVCESLCPNRSGSAWLSAMHIARSLSCYAIFFLQPFPVYSSRASSSFYPLPIYPPIIPLFLLFIHIILLPCLDPSSPRIFQFVCFLRLVPATCDLCRSPKSRDRSSAELATALISQWVMRKPKPGGLSPPLPFSRRLLTSSDRNLFNILSLFSFFGHSSFLNPLPSFSCSFQYRPVGSPFLLFSLPLSFRLSPLSFFLYFIHYQYHQPQFLSLLLFLNSFVLISGSSPAHYDSSPGLSQFRFDGRAPQLSCSGPALFRCNPRNTFSRPE